jgi:hypothetical protein
VLKRDRELRTSSLEKRTGARKKSGQRNKNLRVKVENALVMADNLMLSELT